MNHENQCSFYSCSDHLFSSDGDFTIRVWGQSILCRAQPCEFYDACYGGRSGKEYDQQIINGAPLWWNFERYEGCEGTPYVNAFPSGNHNVLIITEAVPLQNHLDWSETHYNAARFFRYALDNNENRPVRFYLYETWHCINTGTPAGCDWDNGDSIVWKPRLKRDLPLWTGIIDEMRNVFKDEEIWMVPAGQAFYNLLSEAEAGNVPGITSFTDLFTDDIHLNNKGNYFVALVMYVCIFRESPLGLSTQLKDRFGNNFQNMPTEAQALIMQKVAWETVMEFSDLSGVFFTSGVNRDTDIPKKKLLHAYPNPSSQKIYISGAQPYSDIHILKTDGQIVMTTKNSEIDIIDLLPGVYFIINGNRTIRFIRL